MSYYVPIMSNLELNLTSPLPPTFCDPAASYEKYQSGYPPSTWVSGSKQWNLHNERKQVENKTHLFGPLCIVFVEPTGVAASEVSLRIEAVKSVRVGTVVLLVDRSTYYRHQASADPTSQWVKQASCLETTEKPISKQASCLETTEPSKCQARKQHE